jgi:hypothetical protein
MWSGRQTLASIEGTLNQVYGQEGELDRALRSAVGDAERLRKERSEALRELARVKLDEIAAGRLVTNLDAGERRALQILEDYRMRIAAATEQREALLKEVASAEAERHAAAAAVETALRDVETDRAQAETKVQVTPEWRAAKAASDQAEAVAVEAEKKASASEAELGAKKKPYDDDPLFAYLWRRRFGTAEYHGGALYRAIDHLVADFVGYGDARLNYAALIEIPLRLREHASVQRNAAAVAHGALAEIERRAMLEAGVTAKEEQLATSRHKLAAVDDTAEKKRELLSEVDASRGALVAGDPTYNEALTTIAEADSKSDISVLYAEARRTPTSADETIVRRIEGIDQGIAKAESEIANLRRGALELSHRRLEMERVRDRFRQSGYDHPQTTFDNDGAIAGALRDILQGAVRSGALWDVLRGGYSYQPTRSRPDFGGSSFPFPFPMPGGRGPDATGGAWRDPSTRGGWSPEPPRSRSKDDDFSTGGTF